MQRRPKRSRARRLLTRIALILALLVLAQQSTRLADQLGQPQRVDDFVEYWSAGRLLLAGENPYAAEKLYPVQAAVGWREDQPLMMWNPPWTFPLILPFAFFAYPVGRLLWLAVHYMALLLCADWLWRAYGGSVRWRWIGWVLATIFVPTIVVLGVGQIGPLILAGVVLFLLYVRRGWWGWAGAATLLIAVKPQLLYLFWVALLLWAVDRRCWRLVFGGMAAGLAALGMALAFNPAVVGHYLQSISSTPPHDVWATPTIGLFLRLIFGMEKAWLQFVPSVIGAFWMFVYWRQQRHKWNWQEQMPLLLLISLMTTPFGWSFDQVVLLPAILQAGVWMGKIGPRPAAGWIMVVYLLINAIAMAMHQKPVSDHLYVWMPMALLALYLFVRKQSRQETRPNSETSGVLL